MRTLKWGAKHRGVPGHARALGHHELTVGAGDQGGEAELGRGHQSGCDSITLALPGQGGISARFPAGHWDKRRGAARGQAAAFN